MTDSLFFWHTQYELIKREQQKENFSEDDLLQLFLRLGYNEINVKSAINRAREYFVSNEGENNDLESTDVLLTWRFLELVEAANEENDKIYLTQVNFVDYYDLPEVDPTTIYELNFENLGWGRGKKALLHFKQRNTFAMRVKFYGVLADAFDDQLPDDCFLELHYTLPAVSTSATKLYDTLPNKNILSLHFKTQGADPLNLARSIQYPKVEQNLIELAFIQCNINYGITEVLLSKCFTSLKSLIIRDTRERDELFKPSRMRKPGDSVLETTFLNTFPVLKILVIHCAVTDIDILIMKSWLKDISDPLQLLDLDFNDEEQENVLSSVVEEYAFQFIRNKKFKNDKHWPIFVRMQLEQDSNRESFLKKIKEYWDNLHKRVYVNFGSSTDKFLDSDYAIQHLEDKSLHFNNYGKLFLSGVPFVQDYLDFSNNLEKLLEVENDEVAIYDIEGCAFTKVLFPSLEITGQDALYFGVSDDMSQILTEQHVPVLSNTFTVVKKATNGTFIDKSRNDIFMKQLVTKKVKPTQPLEAHLLDKRAVTPEAMDQQAKADDSSMFVQVFSEANRNYRLNAHFLSQMDLVVIVLNAGLGLSEIKRAKAIVASLHNSSAPVLFIVMGTARELNLHLSKFKPHLEQILVRYNKTSDLLGDGILEVDKNAKENVEEARDICATFVNKHGVSKTERNTRSISCQDVIALNKLKYEHPIYVNSLHLDEPLLLEKCELWKQLGLISIVPATPNANSPFYIVFDNAALLNSINEVLVGETNIASLKNVRQSELKALLESYRIAAFLKEGQGYTCIAVNWFEPLRNLHERLPTGLHNLLTVETEPFKTFRIYTEAVLLLLDHYIDSEFMISQYKLGLDISFLFIADKVTQMMALKIKISNSEDNKVKIEIDDDKKLDHISFLLLKFRDYFAAEYDPNKLTRYQVVNDTNFVDFEGLEANLAPYKQEVDNIAVEKNNNGKRYHVFVLNVSNEPDFVKANRYNVMQILQERTEDHDIKILTFGNNTEPENIVTEIRRSRRFVLFLSKECIAQLGKRGSFERVQVKAALRYLKRDHIFIIEIEPLNDHFFRSELCKTKEYLPGSRFYTKNFGMKRIYNGVQNIEPNKLKQILLTSLIEDTSDIDSKDK